ncbi:hypothetical protein [Aquirufa aurantiipilula]|uniref:Uncharacterized protein n=1 Tax=Aquirufa aurantiipilula TaxID=2696561 RepID=A0ABT6BJV2_9BACT|nr:hypothetical protein [Aquirufa aurantiipilula]MBZ1326128.1 hypothetical protein [Aquirufa aurantiipilula]MDF5690634.1 hypothetical protein [Aquirufa aurantiipilula]
MKYLVLFCLISFSIPAHSTVADSKMALSYSSSTNKKVAKYRKKKGFLWGLFKKKKKGCDCPKL